MHSGALLLRSENDRYRRSPAGRHRRRPHGLRPDRAGPRHPDLPQSDRRLGRGGLRLSAARGRRRRHAQDGDRRARRDRRHQGPQEGARSLRAGQGHRPEGEPDRSRSGPNIFTNSVANIGPRETVVVQIEYQEPVRQSGDEFSLRVPLVVAPRYNPAPIVQTVDIAGDGRGWGQVNDPVPDRDRITPPVLDPRSNPPVNPGHHHGAPAGRLSARRGEEPPPHRHHRDRRRRHPRHQARRRRRCRPTAISS